MIRPVAGAPQHKCEVRPRRDVPVIYVPTFADAVYVLHAFQKKTQKTRREDIELARQRYRLIEK
jgi:phage-related protein